MHKIPRFSMSYKVPGYQPLSRYYPSIIETVFANLTTSPVLCISQNSTDHLEWVRAPGHELIVCYNPRRPGSGTLFVEAREFRAWFAKDFEMHLALFYFRAFGAYRATLDGLYQPKPAFGMLANYVESELYFYFDWGALLRLCPEQSAAEAQLQIGRYPDFSSNHRLIAVAAANKTKRLAEQLAQLGVHISLQPF